jgi:uncharacterized protein YkwD
MPFILIKAIAILSLNLWAPVDTGVPASPLASYSSEWNDPKYVACNTAADASYMSEEEKKLLYVLNLARTNPRLFANTVVKKFPAVVHDESLRNISEYNSLLETLRKQRPLPLVYPDSLGYVSAHCHAETSGMKGYTGHERQTRECKDSRYYTAECCHYGYTDAVAILVSLLVDQNVPSLGHRTILLSAYTTAGVSIQPHKTYGVNTVIDFRK